MAEPGKNGSGDLFRDDVGHAGGFGVHERAGVVPLADLFGDGRRTPVRAPGQSLQRGAAGFPRPVALDVEPLACGEHRGQAGSARTVDAGLLLDNRGRRVRRDAAHASR
jgi:hypothetical protein